MRVHLSHVVRVCGGPSLDALVRNSWIVRIDHVKIDLCDGMFDDGDQVTVRPHARDTISLPSGPRQLPPVVTV